jgi:hypothetical protein
MLAHGAVSKFLFTHYHDKANYVEMINSKIRAVLSTFADTEAVQYFLKLSQLKIALISLDWWTQYTLELKIVCCGCSNYLY